jgi:hypothetical protein
VQTRVCFAGNVTRHPAFRHYFQPFAIADEVGSARAVALSPADRPTASVIAAATVAFASPTTLPVREVKYRCQGEQFAPQC